MPPDDRVTTGRHCISSLVKGVSFLCRSVAECAGTIGTDAEGERPSQGLPFLPVWGGSVWTDGTCRRLGHRIGESLSVCLCCRSIKSICFINIYVSPPLSLIRFGQLLRYADKQMYIDRNNLQVELMRCSKKNLTLLTFHFVKRRIQCNSAHRMHGRKGRPETTSDPFLTG